MILDQIDNAARYHRVGQSLAEGLALLADEQVTTAGPGRYSVRGDELFYVIEEYRTKPVAEGRFEVHRRYLDIQAVLVGAECIGYTAPLGLIETEPYNSSRDIAFYQRPPKYSRLIITPGVFAVFWPGQPHMPALAIEAAAAVKKIVVKIRME
jgi:YhcH/YjgK/YiaL family protein